jgi:hypothetical protein
VRSVCETFLYHRLVKNGRRVPSVPKRFAHFERFYLGHYPLDHDVLREPPIMGNAAVRPKHERKARKAEINQATTQAAQNLRSRLDDGKGTALVPKSSLTNYLIQGAATQLERGTMEFTKADLIAILASLAFRGSEGGDASFLLELQSHTVPELRALIRLRIYAGNDTKPISTAALQDAY